MELQRYGRCERGGCGKQGTRKEWIQADNHGDGHGLAESTGRPKCHSPDDADARTGQHDFSEHLPLCRAQAQGTFKLLAGHYRNGVSRERGDYRQNHDEEHAAGEKEGNALRGRLEREFVSRYARKPWLHRALEPRRQHQQAPQSVNHARNSGEQLDKGREEDP